MIKDFFKNHSIHKKIVPYFDSLFIFRPTLFFAVWVMICIGMYLSNLNSNGSIQWIYSIDIKTILLFFSLTFIIGGTFITNQIIDLISDKKNYKLLILDRYISTEKAKQLYKISLIIGFIMLFFTNIYNLILGILIFIFWDIIYNKGNNPWNKHPVLGPLCNLIVGIFLLLSGWCIASSNNDYFPSIYSLISLQFISLIIPYGLCYLSVVLLADIPDMRGDKIVKKKSFGLSYGRKFTILTSVCIVSFSFLLGIYLNDPLLSVSTISSIPFFLYALIRNLDKDILRAIRYPIFILNFFAFTVYPYLFIVLFIVFYLSKYYYWHRFGLHYPTFLVEND